MSFVLRRKVLSNPQQALRIDVDIVLLDRDGPCAVSIRAQDGRLQDQRGTAREAPPLTLHVNGGRAGEERRGTAPGRVAACPGAIGLHGVESGKAGWSSSSAAARRRKDMTE
ncbi:hypothetical protein ACFZDJ_27395 [Streptomyces sp. NPDC007896]|uniref:hypothetical protein n=1 Tax=Streptomyces sp. NPDC007896 TaxID=3364784 RepID=UPI0036E29D63